jgi:glutamate--cysteine ligase
MSNPGAADETPVTSVAQMAAYLASGCKPRDRWAIGTEHEKFGFRVRDHRTPAYEDGIRPLLEGLQAQGWAPIMDRGNVIGLTRGKASISLEPAGQFELSGATLATVHETRAELDEHFAEVRPIAERLGLDFAMLGFHPTAARDDMPWMPKGRYAIMRRYMPLVGGQGLDMMLRTCTVQVNLDFHSEADMVEKLRLSLALQPLATALFANSPFREGRDTGFASWRSQVWTDTDADRTGIPKCVFEDGFGFERFVDYILDVPMYFVYRNGTYHDVAGASFRAFMAGRLPGFEGQLPTMGDFADHITTVFTEVRLKKFLEMRGADAGPSPMLAALPALWVGLLYDDAAQKAAWSLVRDRCTSDIFSLRNTVPRMGLAAPWCGHTARELARDILTIAEGGLRARGRRNARGEDETIYLAPLREIVDSGQTWADRWRAALLREWGGDISRVFQTSALFGFSAEPAETLAR